MRKCWNRQTGTFEVRVSMTCGFKSHLPHQKSAETIVSALFVCCFSGAARLRHPHIPGILFFPRERTGNPVRYEKGAPRQLAAGLLFLLFRPDQSLYRSTRLTSTSTILSSFSTVMHSKGPWQLNPPVPRLGQGRPLKLSVAPSVPPRMGVSAGSRPALRRAVRAFSMRWKWGWIFSIILK